MQTTARAHSPVQVHTGFAHPEKNVDALGIEPGMQVADLGAGSGAYALAIAARIGGEGKLYAVDIQKDLLRRIHNEAVHRGLSNVAVLWADLEKPHAVKVGDHSLDLVLISNLLFQLEDKIAPLKEARRLLKKGGRLAIVDWADSFGGLGPVKQHVVTKEAAHTLAMKEGFDLLREIPAGSHHWGIVLRLSGASRS